ncbi:hypothetical protein M569_07813, partial [Genlisea aurea]
ATNSISAPFLSTSSENSFSFTRRITANILPPPSSSSKILGGRRRRRRTRLLSLNTTTSSSCLEKKCIAAASSGEPSFALLEALLFDCDGVLVDTEKDGHRVSFNDAFEEKGLGVTWDVDLYGELLKIGGGKER